MNDSYTNNREDINCNRNFTISSRIKKVYSWNLLGFSSVDFDTWNRRTNNLPLIVSDGDFINLYNDSLLWIRNFIIINWDLLMEVLNDFNKKITQVS